jgi:acetylornithine deacetylase/succinyl-diaminopimelate desuccinylase-like protein
MPVGQLAIGSQLNQLIFYGHGPSNLQALSPKCPGDTFMADLDAIDRYLEQHREAHLEQLFEWLRIASVSADSQFRPQVDLAAGWVEQLCRRCGWETERIEGGGPPMVIASTPAVDSAPCVLVYGHYDVQPADPLALWQSPPFEPQLRDGNIYARGATDDKGQLLTHLLGAAAWQGTGQPLPLQLKFLIEGEEEVGSRLLEEKLPELADRLACDAIVISDSSQFGPGQPAITYGLRGIAYFELHVSGPRQDLHSGLFGGAVTNPALALANLLTAMRSADGRINLPEFYDAVQPLEAEERAQWQGLNFSDQQLADQLQVSGLTGESGYSTLERRWGRPSFDVHGLTSGYQGEGGKTIIPSRASAKLSFRLVPNQQPDQVASQLRRFVAQHTPPGVTCEVIDLHGGQAVVVDRHSPLMAAAARAIAAGFGQPPVFIREGGSIPIVSLMVEHLTDQVLLMGWGQADDNAHSPNEKFALQDFYRGIRTSSHLWQELASAGRADG